MDCSCSSFSVVNSDTSAGYTAILGCWHASGNRSASPGSRSFPLSERVARTVSAVCEPALLQRLLGSLGRPQSDTRSPAGMTEWPFCLWFWTSPVSFICASPVSFRTWLLHFCPGSLKTARYLAFEALRLCNCCYYCFRRIAVLGHSFWVLSETSFVSVSVLSEASLASLLKPQSLQRHQSMQRSCCYRLGYSSCCWSCGYCCFAFLSLCKGCLEWRLALVASVIYKSEKLAKGADNCGYTIMKQRWSVLLAASSFSHVSWFPKFVFYQIYWGQASGKCHSKA